MIKKLVYAISLLVVVTTIPGCKEKEGCTDPTANNYDSDAEKEDNTCTYTAGTGGNVTLVLKPEHHQVPIVSDSTYLDTAYIKFNTQNSPGENATDYDLVIAGEVGEDHVHVEGMKRGKYFIRMTGWDPAGTGERVTGGIPLEFSQTSGELEVKVPVTED